VISVRYSAGKVWANFACAIVAGLVAVFVIGSLWDGSALIGGLTAMVVVVVMLLPGVLKRAARSEPVVTIDGRGVTIDLHRIGTISWSQIRGATIKGIAWVTGQRLIVEYAGTAPKLGVMDKLNWGLMAKQRGEVVKLSIGFIDLTDQSKQALEGALSRSRAAAA
jgi:hypothetical protein